MQNQILQVALILAISACVMSAQDLYPPMKLPFAEIIRDARPLCTVVCGKDTGTAGNWAAQEVKKYLGKMTGADVPIHDNTEEGIFAIRIVRDPALAEEQLRIRCDGATEIVLAGGGPRGIMYAACAFLEECLGIRWFMPTDYGEVVPQVPRGTSLRVGVFDRTEQPSFPLRWVGRDADWGAHNRMNVDLPVATMKIALPGHTFDKTIPQEKYFEAHPEWFSFKRSTGKRHPRQLCTSNPDLIQEIIKNLRVILDADPEIRVIGLCPNDGTGFCECDGCMALDEPGHPTVVDVNERYVQLGEERRTALSRRFLIFFNEVARALRESHPKVILRCFVYNAYLAPPDDQTLRCEPNVMIQICHNTCHNHPSGADPCPANADFRKYVDRWAAICEHTGFYEYYGKGASMLLPWPMIHCIRADIPYLHQKKVWGFYTQWSPSYIAPAGLNFYVAAKLLWNADTDVDALMRDFFEKFYGPAAAPMERAHNRLEERVARSPLHAKGSSDCNYQFVMDWFASDVVDACMADFAKAKGLANDPIILRRIAIEEASLTYAKLMREYGQEVQRLKDAGVTNPTPADLDEALRRAKVVQEFAAQHKGEGVQLSKYAKSFLNPKAALKRMQAPLANAW